MAQLTPDKVKAIADSIQSGGDVEFDDPEMAQQVSAYIKSQRQPMPQSGAEGGSGGDMENQPAESHDDGAISALLSGAKGNLPFANKKTYADSPVRTDFHTTGAVRLQDELDSSPQASKDLGRSPPYGGDTGRQAKTLPLQPEERALQTNHPVAYSAGAMIGKLPEAWAQGRAVMPFAPVVGSPLKGRNTAVPSAESAIAGVPGPNILDEWANGGVGFGPEEKNMMAANERYQQALEKLSESFDPETAEGVLGIQRPFPHMPTTSESAGVVRDNASFPYTASGVARSIDEIPSAMKAPGSLANPSTPSFSRQPPPNIPVQPRKPGAWVPQRGQNQSIDFGPSASPADMDQNAMANANNAVDALSGDEMYKAASTQDLNSIARPGPYASSGPRLDQGRAAVPPPREASFEPQPAQDPMVSQAEQVVRDRAMKYSDKSDYLPSRNIATQTTAAIDYVGRKLGIAVGVHRPQIEAMQEILSKTIGASKSAASAINYGPKSTNASVLGSIVDSLANAKDDQEMSMLDYLYKEMYPEYNQLSMAAQRKVEEK